MDGASDKGSFKIGYSRNEEKGVLPNSHLLKNIVNFGSAYKLTDRLTVNASANYSNVDGRGQIWYRIQWPERKPEFPPMVSDECRHPGTKRSLFQK